MCKNVNRFIVYISLLCIFAGCSDKLLVNTDNKGEDILYNKEQLISDAKAIAVKEGMKDTDYYVKILTENDLIIVEFYPKDTSHFGGGGRVFFKKENGEYKFFDMKLWQ